jgi:hypothetical protein
LPTPNAGEKQSDFIGRCVPYVKKEHPEWPQDQCVAVCYSIWRRSKEEKKMSNEKILLHLCIPLELKETVSSSDKKKNMYDTDRTTILVGDKTYNGIFFPKEELAKAFHTWEKQPINLDHSDKVEDIVGHVENVIFDDIKNGITVDPVIGGYVKSIHAQNYINGRKNVGAVPEVSVGVWCDKDTEEVNGKEMLVARNLHGDHLAIVTRGACGPEDGCGVGLSDDGNDASFSVDYDEEEYIKKLELMIKIEEEKLKGG